MIAEGKFEPPGFAAPLGQKDIRLLPPPDVLNQLAQSPAMMSRSSWRRGDTGAPRAPVS
ncbi:hypothetical protein MES5069_520008 [Mesorhizobium escarrei]|uniref:Uncharacterized protein n=1 Tax=Mesorhizobium escarrei TaxID=666018 RepID=A0ABN8K7I4_9HYPH|nr:hypothetical protein MES5069_520008 [Mesorhizobium escarrei]